jgi:hypothetical protein
MIKLLAEPRRPREAHGRIGDRIWARAQAHAAHVNGSEFTTSIRERALRRERFVRYIAMEYPVVVGFNRALIRSLNKLDNVRQAPLVKALAVQLQEEQIHNDMWRAMLESFGVDHLALYTELREYLSQFSQAKLDSLARDVIDALAADRRNTAPGIFPASPFPEPVVALVHHMEAIATGDASSFWCHFASQSAVEMTLFEVTSAAYSGIAGNPELDCGPRSTAWWKEHTRSATDGAERSIEEKHLHIARHTLNRSREANACAEEILRVTEESLLLFAATITCHNVDRPVDRF